jgi:hypothetical protein
MEIPKTLYTGTLSTEETTIYAPKKNVATIITNITVVNKTAGIVLLNLLKTSQGNQVNIYTVNLSYGANYSSRDNTQYTLGLGDSLQAYCDTANALDVNIDGIQQTVDSSKVQG